MRYSTKLYIAGISISLISSFFAIGIVEILTRRYFFKTLQSRVISVAATTASLLDGDLVKQIRTEEDQETPVYVQIRNQLRQARDVNRGKDIYIKFIYIIYPDPSNPTRFLFAVDAEEDPKDFSPISTENPQATTEKLYDHLYERYSYGKLTKDPWGTWLTGYYPIYDSQGEYVASLGADISAALVRKDLNYLLLFAFIAFGLSIFEAVIVVSFHAKKVTRALKILEAATVEISKGNYQYRVQLETNDEFTDLAKMMNRMNQDLEEKERLKRGFAHYVSQNVMERLLKEKNAGKLPGEKRKITVLYSDIRNFARLAESMNASDVISFLNEYFKKMLDIIFKHNGMLDKMIGDGIIAEFGIPIDDPEQEINAISTAIEMQDALKELRQKWNQSPIEINVGIHTGEAIVGSIDSPDRMLYTSIGDVIQIAIRLDQMTQEKNCPILISETTEKAVRGRFTTENLGSVPGLDKPLTAFCVRNGSQ